MSGGEFTERGKDGAVVCQDFGNSSRPLFFQPMSVGFVATGSGSVPWERCRHSPESFVVTAQRPYCRDLSFSSQRPCSGRTLGCLRDSESSDFRQQIASVCRALASRSQKSSAMHQFRSFDSPTALHEMKASSPMESKNLHRALIQMIG